MYLATSNKRGKLRDKAVKLNGSIGQFELFIVSERSNGNHGGRLKMKLFLLVLQYQPPQGPENQEMSMNVMKRKLLVGAIAVTFAATSAVALAHDSAHDSNDSTMKMEETMTHERMMNHDDAVKHDKIVKHDLAMKQAAAEKEAAMKEAAARKKAAAEEAAMKKEAKNSDSMDSSKRAAGTAAAGMAVDKSMDAKQGRMNENMDARKDALDSKQERMNERMESKQDAVDAKQERMNENMEAKEDAMEARKDAKEEILENKADAKKDKVDELDSTQPVTDSWITTKVKSELAVTEGVSSLQITVDTVDGVVFLTGVVDSADNAAKAKAAAKSVQGVKKVDSSGLKSM